MFFLDCLGVMLQKPEHINQITNPGTTAVGEQLDRLSGTIELKHVFCIVAIEYVHTDNTPITSWVL